MAENFPYVQKLVENKSLEKGRFLIEGEVPEADELRRLGLCSVRGRSHKLNDDFLHMLFGISFRGETFDLYAVYDGVSVGMRNYRQGAKASSKAALAVNEFFRDFSSLCRDPEDLVHSALDYANNSLDKQTNATTAVLAFFNQASGVCYFGSVGDSRICIIRDETVIPAARLHRHPQRRNIITRKLGPDRTGRIKEERGDTAVFILLHNDIILLASDGIEHVTDEQMIGALKKSSNLQHFTQLLVKLGKPKGDDCTVIAIPV